MKMIKNYKMFNNFNMFKNFRKLNNLDILNNDNLFDGACFKVYNMFFLNRLTILFDINLL